MVDGSPARLRGRRAAAAILVAFGLVAFALTSCAPTPPIETGPSEPVYAVGPPYQVDGEWRYPKEQFDYVETGIATWYGPGLHGRRTANGEIFDRRALTAAHPTLQLPSLVRVTNLENGRSIILRVNDRGPFVRGRILDVSEYAAELLGFKTQGLARVRIVLLQAESERAALTARQRGEINRSGDLVQTVTAGAPSAAPRGAVTAAPLEGTGSDETAAPQPAAANDAPLPSLDDGPPTDPMLRRYPVTDQDLYIRTGVFSALERADQLRRRVATIAPGEVEATPAQGLTLYRLRLGPLHSIDAADDALEQLAAIGQIDARIVVE